MNNLDCVTQRRAKSSTAGTDGTHDRRPLRRLTMLGLTVLAMVAIAGCASDGGDNTIVVFAAASLTDAFTEVAADYEQANPDQEVDLRFGGSSRLLAQLEDGAQGSVFASADEVTMERAVDSGVTVGAAEPIATNQVAVIVPEGNPRALVDAADLIGSSLIIAACAVEVPCGRAAQAFLDNLDLTDEVTITSREPNVRAVVTRVTSDEVDVGFVYASDAAQLDRTQTLAQGVEAGRVTLMAATIDDSAIAQSFVDYLRSDEARLVLERWGFGAVDQ